MTADQLYDTVVALCAWEQVDKADYKERFIALLNLRLQELFTANNARRLHAGKEPLDTAQRVGALSDELTYEDEITGSILPVAIAGYLYVEDDETGLSNVFREDYRTKKAQLCEHAAFETAGSDW